MLILNRKPRERIVVVIPPGTCNEERHIIIQVGEARKSKVQLLLTSPREMYIHREETCPPELQEKLPPRPVLRQPKS